MDAAEFTNAMKMDKNKVADMMKKMTLDNVASLAGVATNNRPEVHYFLIGTIEETNKQIQSILDCWQDKCKVKIDVDIQK